MLQNDPDYVALKRFSFSLQKLRERYPDGCPDRIAADALGLTEDELNSRHTQVVLKLRELMGA